MENRLGAIAEADAAVFRNAVKANANKIETTNVIHEVCSKRKKLFN